MDIKAALGNRVRHLREKKGLSQAALAERTNRSVHAISMIERGKNWPNASTLEAIAEALSIAPARILNALLDNADANSRDTLLRIAKAALTKVSDKNLPLAVDILETLAKRDE